MKASWWEQHSRELDRDSLVCILVQGQPVCFATVAHREPRELAHREPSFGIVPFNASERRELTALMLRKQPFQILQCDTAFFSVEHVLIGLQRMTRIPFATELVNYKKAGDKAWGTDLMQHPAYQSLVEQLRKGGKASELIKSKKLQGGLDASQEKAVLYGLQYRTAFIQGPPGTGKSFVGALIAKAIFDTTDETIICVCYTNHALDQFLLDLIAHGIAKENLVRIGSSKRIHPDLEVVKLFGLADQQSESQGVRKEIAIACKSIEVIQQQLAELKRENLLFWLKDNLPTWWNRFRVDANSIQSSDGLQLVVSGKKKNEKLTIWYLLNAWTDGAKATGVVLQLLQRNGHATAHDLECWTYTKAQRRDIVEVWEREMDEGRIDEYSSLISALHREQKKRTDSMLFRKKIALENRRIIGCTTTGAAKNFSLLQHVQAGVLIVEEAGEILEPHILTAMSDKIKHVVQIGDHKQLRPKIDSYELSVGHRNGYDLNRSMFERMVLSGFPHPTLAVQHRMHDDIAAMVRALTYKDLQTSARVTPLTHPPLRGILPAAGRVLFVNHEIAEGSHQSLMMRDDGASAHSKVNLHEARMVVRTARYLLQNDYQASQLVLLTPYLGQVTVLRDELSKLSFEASINHMDQKDIAVAEMAQAKDDGHPGKSASHAASASSSSNVPLIKIATIDNYQGEESDVVLVSLVRCNASNAIGFTGKAERVNVLLSRARHGMIVFGNVRTLENQKAGNDEWKKVLKLERTHAPAAAAAAAGATSMAPPGGVAPLKLVDVRNGLAVVCTRHSSQHQLLSTPEDFDKLAPRGGCTQVCAHPMECGKHSCPLPCHSAAFGASHSASSCTAEVMSRCAANKHALRHACCLPASSVRCQEKLTIRCGANKHNIIHACHAVAGDCRECRKEKERLEKEAADELARVEQLRQELAYQQATLQSTLKYEAATAERELQEKLIKLQVEQNKELLAMKQAELKRQEAEALEKSKQDHLQHIAQLKQQLEMGKQKAQANPLHASAAAAAVQHLAAASSSSSSPAPKVKAPPAALFNALDSKSMDYQSIALQFHTSFANMPDYHTLKFDVTAVQKIHSPTLAAVYEKAKKVRAEQAKAAGCADLSVEWTVYHGTHPDNITNIALHNLSMSHKGKLDPGWFGAGLYFSRHADYTMMYSTTGEFRPVKAGDRGRLFQFQVMPGRIKHLQSLAMGQPQTAGYESHLTPTRYELILFDNRVVLPTHVIDFVVSAAPGANFQQSVEKNGK